jgi:hypothetical protein
LIITKEDYNDLTNVISIVSKILRNAVYSEQEEHERQFDNLNRKQAYNLTTKELKKMPNFLKELISPEWLKSTQD